MNIPLPVLVLVYAFSMVFAWNSIRMSFRAFLFVCLLICLAVLFLNYVVFAPPEGGQHAMGNFPL